MSIKVLVADDSITIQKVIGIIFGGDEYSLTVVDNGKAAVDKAREINPDILLIDALMPGMTGYEVAEAVRSTPALASKPILILTGSFEPFDEEKAKKCGADDFIAKPFESQQIITKVKELLALGSSRAQSAPQPVVPEPASEQAPVISAPVLDVTPPATESQTEAPADIWGAFTPEVEQPIEAVAAPTGAAYPEAESEPDVFAIVSEENGSQLVQTAAPEDTSPTHTGSQWVPVEENTFEFEEEVIADPPQTAFAEQTVPAQEASFGDISFEEEEIKPATPASSFVPEPVLPDFAAPAAIFEAPAAPAAPFAPLADPTPIVAAPVESAPIVPVAAASTSVALTEDQLKAALASASKDVIERIVWEVVPDLAEALIREAIRKIKEGV
ncbi:MAG: response regulator [Pelobacteraceae bacterium]